MRAVRDYTEMGTIQAQIFVANDLQARRISAAENMQREDLSSIETIEAIVDIVDAELIEDIEYLSMGKTPVDWVKTLLARLDSVRSSQERGRETLFSIQWQTVAFSRIPAFHSIENAGPLIWSIALKHGQK